MGVFICVRFAIRVYYVLLRYVQHVVYTGKVHRGYKMLVSVVEYTRSINVMC